MANAGDIVARLRLENDDFRRGAEAAKQDMEQMSAKAKSVSDDIKTIQKISAAAFGGATAAIGGSIAMAANFEQGMARVKAISGATDEEFAALTQTARDLGRTTRFTSMDAADGLAYLSMAGFTATQSMEALPGVLNLAGAAGIDLGSSADIVSNILQGFGMSADDTGRAVDVLVEAMTSANTDLPQLGNAMSYVAPVASALGLSIEETTAAVAKLSDAGIQGGKAGTTLRMALLSLANPTGQTEKAMEKLGINVLTAEGAMKPLPELIGEIADKTEGMTDAQKTQTVAQLVGTQAASGFIALLDVGEDALADYTQGLKESEGAAQAIADTQNNTVLGAFDAFKSALADIGISIGNEYLPMVKDVLNGGADMLRKFGDLDPALVTTALNFIAISSGIGLAITTIGKLAIAIKGLYASMGPAGWLILGISLLGGAIISSKIAAEDFTEVNLELAETMIETQDALQLQIDQFDELSSKSRLTTDEFMELIDIQDELGRAVDQNRIDELTERQEALREKSGLSNDELNTMIGLNDSLIEKVPETAHAISEQGNRVVETTDSFKDYNKELNDATIRELERQKIIAEGKERELQEEVNQLKKEHNESLELEKEYRAEFKNFDEEASIARIEQLQSQLDSNELRGRDAQFARASIKAEEDKLERFREQYVSQMEISDELAEQIKQKETEIGMADEINGMIVEQLLQQVGLNGTREDGIGLLEEAIAKEQEQIDKSEELRGSQEGLNEQVDAEIGRRNEAIAKYQDAKAQIEEILGLQSSTNDAIQTGTGNVGELEIKYRGAVDRINDGNSAQVEVNNRIDEGIKKGDSLNQTLAERIAKLIDVDDQGGADALNEKLSRPITKSITFCEGKTFNTKVSSTQKKKAREVLLCL
ncbi:phage tail tape measure protein [Shouchella hunanensis]|uniref:Phage tail tape measure protein n=1 Tax=Shouchella hunanensis TaxID=766894 RepID=A0ABY7W1D2_9BACI|nr:phage tail tape measure protein [Shouchella hunanensis]WDF02752.1 phage tail tape measure protein [Shouchella hunanensis]